MEQQIGQLMKRIRPGRILSGILVLALLAALLPARTQEAEAARYKTQSVTLLVGERLSVTVYENVKGTSSGKKTVATVKKDPDNSRKAIITAKKTGKATVKIRTAQGVATYKITVKKAAFTVKAAAVLPDGNVLYKITNNTSLTFDSMDFVYTLRNPENEVINESDGKGGYRETSYIYNLQPKKTAYATVYTPYGTTADISKCTGKVDFAKYPGSRSISASYTDRSKKVATSVKLDGNEVAVKFKNKYSGRVSGIVYVKIYDGNTLLGVKSFSTYLDGSQSKTERLSISSILMDHPNPTLKLDAASFFSKQY